LSSVLPFVITGLATGAVFGLAATGITLTYKTSGIFNFAQGAIAATAAYVFYWLTTVQGWTWQAAAAVSVIGVGAVFGLLMEAGARRVARSSVVLRIVATVGLVLAVQAAATLKFGTDPIRVEPFLPGAGRTFLFGGVNVAWVQVDTAVISIICATALYAFLRSTRMGLAMRAVVDDPDLVGLHGTNPFGVRRIAWMIGSIFSALSGVLLAPLVGIHAIALTYLIIAAAGAAALGAFSSIPLSFAGGLVIGVAAAISQKYVLQVSSLSGLPNSIPFVVLLLALLVTPRRRLLTNATIDRGQASRERAPALMQWIGGFFVLALLILIPTFVGTDLLYYTKGMALVIMLLSLGLLVRTSGQISLCHSVFAGIGAVAFSQLAVGAGMPWFVALLGGALIVVPIAAVVAIPAIRLTGLFLALGTLAFGITVERLVYPLNIAFTQLTSGRAIPRPAFATSNERYYYVVLAVAVLCAAALVALDRARLGRMLRGIADSPTAVATMGLGTKSIKVLVFCVSGFIAGISGILYGSTVHFATYSDPYFLSFTSLVLVAILAIAPFQTPWYALWAIPVAVLPAYIGGEHAADWLNLAFGVAAIVVALQGGVPSLPPKVWSLAERFQRPSSHKPTRVSGVVELPSGAADTRSRQLEPGLRIEGVSVHFGGLAAVQELSIEAPIGRITGLIGPNGAGKTTTFNACSGLVRPTRGRVSLGGHDITAMSAAARARHGLGRTFQVTELCESLTVAGNVALGREAGMAGSNPVRQVFASRKKRSEAVSAAAEAMALCGISHLAEVAASKLSTGERRLVELARCLAGSFDILLLDEPSAGLDRLESARLGEVLVRVIEQRCCGILLVEHDMALVLGVSDHIYVMDFGQLLFEGSPKVVTASDKVRTAYLGSTADAAERVDADEMKAVTM
jgi:ABC-type branched-subunit amino acid transport system ATPase component/branched-subunit amino acid ABC-type transport system permease component